MDPLLIVVILASGPGAACLGAAACWAFATSWRRVFVAELAGLLAIGGLVAAAVLTAPREPDPSCSDCGEYWGRWLDPYLFYLGLLNALVFALVLVLGSSFRLRTSDARRQPWFAAAAWLPIVLLVLAFAIAPDLI